MTVSIKLTDVSKRFRVNLGSSFLARLVVERLRSRGSRTRDHWALRNIDLEIHAGESVGIIGSNGSGKSTLLSLIAKTMYPTSGTVEVHGRIGSLLELGAGFHPDLTGIENVYLNASLLGLSRAEVERHLDSIQAYADIGEYIEAPLSTYSSGMHARLGFAVIAHIDPDILLIDEVFAVGDAAFTEKSERTIQGFLERGCTLLLVSHGIEQVQRICKRAAWIDQGRLVACGPSGEVCSQYLQAMHAVPAR
jgi:ABC-type polysaccharide/polyol phosphate transport system ATPase subunit